MGLSAEWLGGLPLAVVSLTILAPISQMRGVCAQQTRRPYAQPGTRVLDESPGRESCATVADGQPLIIPRSYRKAEAWRKRRGDRRRQAGALLANAQQQSAGQRRDVHHQEAHHLVQAYDTLYVADLRVANM